VIWRFGNLFLSGRFQIFKSPRCLKTEAKDNLIVRLSFGFSQDIVSCCELLEKNQAKVRAGEPVAKTGNFDRRKHPTEKYSERNEQNHNNIKNEMNLKIVERLRILVLGNMISKSSNLRISKFSC